MTTERTHADRRALVTGAGQGVGRAIACELARRGAHVVVNDLSHERAEQVAAEIAEDGGRATAAAFDVTDWAAVRRAAETSGPVGILVNNAGNAGRTSGMTRDDLTPFVETAPADWEGFLRVNLYGVMHAVRAFLPGMIDASWGRVVTLISDAGRVGEPTLAAYSAAKAGAAGFSRAVAREVGRHGVTVNCVSLGTIGPEDAPADDPERARALGRYVVRRTGRPSEAAALVAFLTGPQAGWVTGQTYPLNGGYAFSH
ncbi:SDR family NAD(P)-dependent oxidoreductase [Actinomadura napierensis]|uniref:SDR family oxidoreductase n=1 Tax=Actinomadura napierensis TaxID=267854 RepID=A0ABP5JPF0_9ACTN